MIVIARQALFEAAWTRPLSELAADWGISDVGLRKICDRHDIPTPGRGYWTQVRAGKSFPRPKLRPAPDPRLEQVHIDGRPLPPAVVAAMQAARAQPALGARPPRRPRRAAAAASDLRPAASGTAPALTPGDAPTAPETPPPAPVALVTVSPRRELAATRKALARAKADAEGFLRVAGVGVVPLRLGPASVDAALGFLEALLAEAERRGWRLVAGDGGLQFEVAGERLAVRIEEAPAKTVHTPTAKELAEKARRDRWGGDNQPWRTWDLSPSGRLALVIDENAWSGLRRTFSQRKGYSFLDALESVVAGLAGHAAAKAERRREDEARAKAAALAAARRERLDAFDRREARRAEFVAAVQAQLAERDRLAKVLAHLEAQDPDPRALLAEMEAWLRRRLQAIAARLDPHALEISARHAEVGFAEPPAKPEPSHGYYSRKIALHLWIPAAEAGRVDGVSELEWALHAGLIADPGAPPTAERDADAGRAEHGESNPAAETSD